MGVCKALFEKHMLPRVLAGSSAGSIGKTVEMDKNQAILPPTHSSAPSLSHTHHPPCCTLSLTVAVSAMIATRTDPELKEMFDRIHQFDMVFFNNNSTAQLVMHVIKKGSLQVSRLDSQV